MIEDNNIYIFSEKNNKIKPIEKIINYLRISIKEIKNRIHLK